MIRKDTRSQEMLWDPWDYLGPKRRQNLERDWPGVVRHHVLDTLPVESIAEKFHPSMGRPTKDHRMILGALLLQQVLDLSDEQTVEALAYDIRWHYALSVHDESDDGRLISERTLWTYRHMAEEMGLSSGLFAEAGEALREAFGVDADKQRLDSTHFLSNMRQLNRAQLFTRVIVGFLQRLKREQGQRYKELIDSRMDEQYLKRKQGGCFAIEPKKAGQCLERLGEDLWWLVKRFEGDETVGRMRTYGLLVRVLQEQCEVVEACGEPPRLRIKDPKEVSANCLQNPSDEDATYDAHKGSGYQIQIMETYREEDSKEKDATVPDLITYVEVQGAHESDMGVVPKVLQESEKRGCKPERLLADGGYGSDDNHTQAAQAGVELVSPSNRGKPENDERLGLEDFTFNKRGEVTQCPAGNAPLKTEQTEKGNFRTCFDRQQCEQCELKDRCPVVLSACAATLPAYSKKKMRLAKRRAEERTEEFKDKYRWRAGEEGTNSRLKHQFGLERLRVRGMPAVRFAAELKALGMNIFRCAKALRARYRRSACPNLVFVLQIQLIRGLGSRLADLGGQKRRPAPRFERFAA